jgi:methionyl-tRNA synthetase
MSFYVTTPIYYVNDVPHVGHAYTTIATDALARYHRARGRGPVRMLTGTDEHGQKIADTAAAKGTTPQAHADSVVTRFLSTWKHLEISNDDYIRTTEARHKQIVQDVWKRLAAAGDIYKGDYEGLYCVGCEAFYTEGQLEQPGNICPDHKTPVGKVKESSYFFAMSKYQDRLIEHFEKNPGFVQPESRRNEILSFIRSGLRDISISRSTFDWGIPVPGDEKHVIYVWIDALTNYISALGGPGAPLYQEFWDHPGAQRVHVIGKDILRFHAVYWPCMLLSMGLPLPTTIFTHGWWTVRGQKISKSLPATKIDPNVIADDLGVDALRYYLLREIPLGLDGDFSFEGLIGRFNSDLANDLGNLLNRTLSMLEKYAGGVVPEPVAALDGVAHHAKLRELAQKARAEAEKHFDAILPARALEAIWELVRGANTYVAEAEPWALAKLAGTDATKKAELGHVLHTFLEASLWAALLAGPVIPGKAREILTQLGVPEMAGRWPTTWNTMLPPGTKIAKPQPIFPRVDEERAKVLLDKWIPPEARVDAAAASAVPTTIDEQVTLKHKSQPNPSVAALGFAGGSAPAKASPVQVSYDEFSRLDLRVAHVVSAEKVPKKDKLLKLIVDLGGGQTRQVVAGIAESYAPEAIVGKRVIFLANLKPAKIGGVESQGMILAAGEEKVVALSALDQEVPPGTKVR